MPDWAFMVTKTRASEIQIDVRPNHRAHVKHKEWFCNMDSSTTMQRKGKINQITRSDARSMNEDEILTYRIESLYYPITSNMPSESCN